MPTSLRIYVTVVSAVGILVAAAALLAGAERVPAADLFVAAVLWFGGVLAARYPFQIRHRTHVYVSDAAFLDTIAGALAKLGARKALVVSSADGLDEMSTSGTTRVVEVDGPELRSYEVSPEDVGLPRARPDELDGGTPDANAETTRRILAGERGAQRDLAVLNAGAAIYVSGRVETLEAGVREAEAAIDDGRAAASLERLVAMTKELAPA